MSWTGVILDILVFAMVTIIGFVSKQYLIPWIKLNHLEAAAAIAVDAAEAIYGRYNGTAKLEQALRQLQEQGWNIDSEVVINAVKAAWKALDLAQLASGEKTPAE